MTQVMTRPKSLCKNSNKLKITIFGNTRFSQGTILNVENFV